jgi:hypothetical protein
VHFVADAEELPAGSYATARVVSAAPHWLAGDLVDIIRIPEPAPARTPVLIPVRAG